MCVVYPLRRYWEIYLRVFKDTVGLGELIIDAQGRQYEKMEFSMRIQVFGFVCVTFGIALLMYVFHSASAALFSLLFYGLISGLLLTLTSTTYRVRTSDRRAAFTPDGINPLVKGRRTRILVLQIVCGVCAILCLGACLLNAYGAVLIIPFGPGGGRGLTMALFFVISLFWGFAVACLAYSAVGKIKA